MRATPKGGRDTVDVIVDIGDGQTALKIRVRAAPADGAANEAIVRVLAEAVDAAPSAIKLLQGAAGRLKTFRISGDPVRLEAALERAVAEKETKRK